MGIEKPWTIWGNEKGRYPEVSLLVGFATEDSLRKLKLEVSLLEGFALLSKWFRYPRKPRRFRYREDSLFH